MRKHTGWTAMAGLVLLAGTDPLGAQGGTGEPDATVPVRPAPRIEDGDLAGHEALLAEALAGGPDFAGDQVLVQLGCGTDCLQVLAIDHRSGRITRLPAVACCWQGSGEMLDYGAASNLLVVSGRLEGDPRHGRHRFLFEAGKFIPAGFEPVPEKTDGEE